VIASVPPVISFPFKTNKIQPQSVSLVVLCQHGACYIWFCLSPWWVCYYCCSSWYSSCLHFKCLHLSFFFMIVKTTSPLKKSCHLFFLFLGTPSLFLCVLFLIFRESIIIYGAWEFRKKNCPNLCYFGHHLVRSRCLTFPSMSFLFPPPKTSECTL